MSKNVILLREGSNKNKNNSQKFKIECCFFDLLKMFISSFENNTNISQYQLTYLSSRTCSSREFSSKVVRSEMVSEAVVPLMVSSRKMVPAPSSSSCLIRWVFSRSSWVRSMLHLKHNEIHHIKGS